MKPIKSDKLRRSAQGKNCTMRVPDICNFNPETVVLCHIRTKGQAGMGQKNNDTFAFYGCSKCHEWYDNYHSLVRGERALFALAALAETQDIMLKEGLLYAK